MSCDCDSLGSEMLPYEQALALLLQQPCLQRQSYTLALAEALDHQLAQDIDAPINVPPYDNSGMDGYAVRAEDLRHTDTLTCIATVLAGDSYTGCLQKGQCIRIMTGAKLPNGADTVVMQEKTWQQDNLIRFDHRPMSGENVRISGEDLASGETIFQQGHTLSPADIGLLASLGINQVDVWARPVVALISTGDELVEPGQPLAPGQIYDSNRYTLRAMLTRLNVEILDFGIIADQPAQIRAALEQANREADLVVSSGGVSVGEADFIKPILAELGQVEFWKVAMKPGKPFAFGRLSHSFFVGLPGNPVAAAVTFDQLAIPLLRSISQRDQLSTDTHVARVDHKLRKRKGRLEFQRGIARKDTNGHWTVRSTGLQGSGILSSMSAANCYILLPADCDGVNAGDAVSIQLYSPTLAAA